MKQRFYKGLAAVSLGALLSLTLTPAEAFVPSIKALGMAATGVAYPQDAESGAYNPANTLWVGDRADSGTSVIRTDGETTATGFTIPQQNGTFPAFVSPYKYNPHLGVTKQFCVRGRRLAAGFVVYNRAQAYSKYDQAFPVIGTDHLRLSYLQEIVNPMLGIEICPGHTVGVALDIVFQRLKINGLENFDNPEASTAPGFVTGNGPSISVGVGVTIGYLGEFGNRLKVGLAYRPETSMTRYQRYKGFIAEQGKQNSPQRIAGGIALKVLPCLNWAIDVEHIAYNRIPALANPLVSPPNLGADDGSAFAWRDRVYIRTGLDYQVNERLNVRMGLRHARVFFPPGKEISAANLLTMDLVEDFITAGFSYRIDCKMEFSFYYGHGFRNTITNPVPIALNPPSFLPGAEVTTAQSRDAFGFGLGLYY
jgi:long-chain fatty acid transport protein